MQAAQMAESVDALVSNTSGATRAGSTPALGTYNTLQATRLARCFFIHQNLGTMNIKNAIFGLSLAMLLLSSCATKQGAVAKLERFNSELRQRGNYASMGEVEDDIKRFGEIRKRIEKFQYTPTERKQIGKLEGQCAKQMAKNMKSTLTNGLLGIGSELQGILEEITGGIDAEDL